MKIVWTYLHIIFVFYILSMRVPSYSIHFQLLNGNTPLNEKEKAVITLLQAINLFFLLYYRLFILWLETT